MKRIGFGLVALKVACVLCLPTAAYADDLNLHDAVWEDHGSGGTILSLAAGAMTGMAYEFAYDPSNGRKISELDWNIKVAETLNLEMSTKISANFRIYLNGSMAINGDNYMDDFDWITSTAPAAASDHSWHDDTRLDHY